MGWLYQRRMTPLSPEATEWPIRVLWSSLSHCHPFGMILGWKMQALLHCKNSKGYHSTVERRRQKISLNVTLLFSRSRNSHMKWIHIMDGSAENSVCIKQQQQCDIERLHLLHFAEGNWMIAGTTLCGNGARRVDALFLIMTWSCYIVACRCWLSQISKFDQTLRYSTKLVKTL